MRGTPGRPTGRNARIGSVAKLPGWTWAHQFLEGEFDYFLTQQGVRRDDVMNSVRDIETKARLEAHMDGRKTGEGGYHRRILEMRAANPARPSRPIEPFGYTKTEARLPTNRPVWPGRSRWAVTSRGVG
jgi:hypothetical protein